MVGTAGADSMTISQTASSITLTTPQGSTSFNGAFTSVVVYDFDGNDTIRTTSTVTASVYISVGDGNDSIFNAATGAGTIILGNGNDLVVSVGAGQTAVTGGAGLDSYWLDSADTLTNVSAASTAAWSGPHDLAVLPAVLQQPLRPELRAHDRRRASR